MSKKLRVSHFPQIPCNPFIVEVRSIEEAKKIFDVLANYDLFQYENRIKPDYCNTTILEYWDEEKKEWLEWHDKENNYTLDEYCRYVINQQAEYIKEIQKVSMFKLENLSKFERKYNNIMESDLDQNDKDHKLAALMTDMERQYNIPLLNDENWNNEHKEIIKLYRIIGNSRNF